MTAMLARCTVIDGQRRDVADAGAGARSDAAHIGKDPVDA
jgi:hypothetical protein